MCLYVYKREEVNGFSCDGFLFSTSPLFLVVIFFTWEALGVSYIAGVMLWKAWLEDDAHELGY